MLSLVPVATLRFETPRTFRLADTPVGTRVLVEFANATLEGPALRAKQKSVVGGDWLTVGPDGIATLEFRLLFETDDGALLFLHGFGRTEAARFAKDGGPMYFAPRIETGDPRYQHLNPLQLVAGGFVKDGVTTLEVSSVSVSRSP